MPKEKILLHSCCGPCSSSCIERLLPEYEITLLYYNPCINDKDEYEKRFKNQNALIDAINSASGSIRPDQGEEVRIKEGTYDPERYETLVKGLEDEPEGGKRCEVCFRMRLYEAAKYAAENGFSSFTTTLTVSPHKDFDLISKIGKEAGDKYGVTYVPFNFKKKDGSKRSVELSKEYGLYRQDYCGCNYSKRNAGT